MIDPVTNQPILVTTGQIITPDQIQSQIQHNSQNIQNIQNIQNPQQIPIYINFNPANQYMFPFNMNQIPFNPDNNEVLQSVPDKQNFKSEKKKPVILDSQYKEYYFIF